MPPTLFLNADLLTPVTRLRQTPMLVDSGRIVAIGAAARVENAQRIDLSGSVIVPGFIDLHVHGGGGHSLVESNPEALDEYSRWVTRFGVTGYLAGTIAPSAERIVRALERGAPLVSKDSGGASLLGFHLEGPFLSPRRRGAFDTRWLLPADAGLVQRFAEAAGGKLRLLTLAPELEGAGEAISAALRCSILPSLGHTDATYEEMMAAIELGAQNVTHCFNAMRPFTHRDPGPIAAALSAPDICCEVIADGEHVGAGALRMLLAARGAGETILVTDGNQLAGAGSGSIDLAGNRVSVRDGRALTPDGALAGSTATMDSCLRNAIHLGGATLLEASRMASLNPAVMTGTAGDRGRLAPGYRADLVVLDSALRVAETWVNGDRVFASKDCSR